MHLPDTLDDQQQQQAEANAESSHLNSTRCNKASCTNSTPTCSLLLITSSGYVANVDPSLATALSAKMSSPPSSREGVPPLRVLQCFKVFMFVRVCTCVYICVCACVYAYIYMCVCVCLCGRVYVLYVTCTAVYA